MKIRILLAAVIVLVSLFAASPALAHEGDPAHCESGAIFGAHHADMAQQGMLNGAMNPGMHLGYSTCLP